MLPTILYLPLLLGAPVEAPTLWTALGITIRPATASLAAPRPSAAHLDIKLTEVDAAQVAVLLKDALPESFRNRLKGRIGRVVVEIRGDQVTMKADKLRLAGEWLTRAEGSADLKGRTYKLKLWAFGGMVEADGTLPEAGPAKGTASAAR